MTIFVDLIYAKMIFVFRFDRAIGRSGEDGSLTAASLIDAIITHQINRTASDPPVAMNRDAHRSAFVSINGFTYDGAVEQSYNKILSIFST